MVNVGEVGLVDRRGHAGVARGDRRTAPHPPVVVLLGHVRGAGYVYLMSGAEVGDEDGGGVGDDVDDLSGFTEYSTRLGGVTVVSTRPAV